MSAPEEPLLALNLLLDNGIICYPTGREREMIDHCDTELMRYIPGHRYHPCEGHG